MSEGEKAEMARMADFACTICGETRYRAILSTEGGSYQKCIGCGTERRMRSKAERAGDFELAQ